MKGYTILGFALLSCQLVFNEGANTREWKTPEGCTCTCPIGVNPQAAWSQLGAWGQPYNNQGWGNSALNNQAWNNPAWNNPSWNWNHQNATLQNNQWSNWNRNWHHGNVDPRWTQNPTTWKGTWNANQQWPYNQWNNPGYAGVNDLRAAVVTARSAEESTTKNNK